MKKNIVCILLMLSCFMTWALDDETKDTTKEKTEIETIQLPEVVTTIEGQQETILAEAIPDFTLELPALSVVVPNVPNSSLTQDEYTQEENDFFAERKKSFFDKDSVKNSSEPLEMQGKIGISYPLGFLGNGAFYRQGKNPFKLEFDAKIINGLGKKSLADNFFVDSFTLSSEKTLIQNNHNVIINGSYALLNLGLQNNSNLFSSEKNQFGKIIASYFYTLSKKASLGFSLQDNIVQQNLSGMQNNGFIGEQSLYNDLSTAIFWNYCFTENLTLAVKGFYDFYANNLQNIHGIGSHVSLAYNNKFLEFTVQAEPGYRKGLFVYPFEGKMLFSFKPFQSVYAWKIGLEGGLRSALSDMYYLAKNYWYTYYQGELQEESDWFAKLIWAIPVTQRLFFDGGLEYGTTAFNRGALVVNYETQREDGLFSFYYKNRSVLNSSLSLNYTHKFFEIIVGWKSFWLYKNAHEFAQNIFIQSSFISEKKNFGGTGLCSFDFQKQEFPLPKLALSLFYVPWNNSKLILAFDDMLSLFSGKERFYAKPYCKTSGSVTFAIQYSY
ncbi:MAG: hypothetical protein E7062_00720 [Spirochaetaceae bacterium]|nr:hypothetical protein [Spirochaetaceae bacterium]